MYKRLSFLAANLRRTPKAIQSSLGANALRHYTEDVSLPTRVNSARPRIQTVYQRYIEECESLTKEDKETASRLLLNRGGIYALDKGYFTVKGFLGLSHKARLRLYKEYDVYIERPCDEDNLKENLDRLFGNNKFNLNRCLTLTKPKWDYLMNLLENNYLALTMVIENGGFTLDEFLDLDIIEQQALWNLVEEELELDDSYHEPASYEVSLFEDCMRVITLRNVSIKIHSQLMTFKDSNQDERVFFKLKFVLSNLVREMLEHHYLTESDQRLYIKINAAQNRDDFEELYTNEMDNKLKLKELWDAYILTGEFDYLFANSNRFKEQLYLLSTNAKSLGVEMTYDEALIQEYIQYTRLILIPYMIENDDERDSCYRHLCRKYGFAYGEEIEPDDHQIRKVIMKDLENALYQGRFQEEIQEMQSRCLDSEYLSSKSEFSAPRI